MQKPKVLFISSWYPSREHPTLGNFVQRHAEAIYPYVDLEVLVVIGSSTTKSFEIDHTIIDGVSTTMVYYKKVSNKVPLLSSYLKYKRYLNSYTTGYELLLKRRKQAHFDLIHVNVTFQSGIFARYLKRKVGLPYVITEHWTGYLPYRTLFSKLPFYVKNMTKKIVADADLLLPVSHHLGKSMNNLGLNKAFEVVPNVVDTKMFIPDESKRPSYFNFLHVSTLDDDQKNISGIFRALKEVVKVSLKEVRLTIVTDGDIDKGIALANEIGVINYINFHGTKTPQEIVEFYQSSHCFLMFSNYENLPCVITESMSCGLPVISTRIAGIPEHLDESKGLMVEPKDEKGLITAMLELIVNYEQFNSKLIRDYAINNFSKEEVGKAYLAKYLKVIQHVS